MDTQKELEEIRGLVQENHKILKKMLVRARIGTAIHIIKWVAIILIALGLYSFLQPFLESIIGTYASVKDAASSIAEVKASLPSEDTLNLLNLFKQQ